jgi:hypothetical protein
MHCFSITAVESYYKLTVLKQLKFVDLYKVGYEFGTNLKQLKPRYERLCSFLETLVKKPVLFHVSMDWMWFVLKS